MSSSPHSWIDRQIDRFEDDWQHARQPTIEAYVVDAPPELREALRQELVVREIELRRRLGEAVDHQAYRQRFPDLLELVDRLFPATSRPPDATMPLATSAPSSYSDRAGAALPDAAFAPLPRLQRENLSTPTSAHVNAPGVAGEPAGSSEQPALMMATGLEGLRFFRRGGLGALYLGMDRELHRETVVKFINESCADDAELLAQFRIEAEITGRLDHPGVVPVYGLGHDTTGRPFYVMRLIRGRELRQVIREYHDAGGPRNSSDSSRRRLYALVEHLASACQTVAYAHDVGVIHCDIKPANIMVGRYDETYVLDWGLATTFERTATFFSPHDSTIRPKSGAQSSQSGQRGGTYGYMSPEQLSGAEHVAPACDIYSLGATLYEILTGRPPFNVQDADVVTRIRANDFPAPHTLTLGVPRALEAICLKALQLRSSERYSTAKLLAADLRNWMRDDPVQAAPDRWIDRVSRLARRHRAAALATTVTLLVVACAAVWGHLTMQHAAREAELREMVESNFTTALDTFEDICKPLANGELTNLSLFRPLADKIAKFSNDYLENFEHSDSMRAYTGRVYELRANVSRLSWARPGEELGDFEHAEGIFAALVREQPNNADYQMRLAGIHVSQGQVLLQHGETGKAETVLASACERLEQLLHHDAANTNVKRSLAEAYHGRGQAYLERDGELPIANSLERAEQFFLKSKALREQLVAESTGSERRNHQRDLARSLGYLGDLYLALGDVSRASRNFEQSKTLREELYRNNSLDPEQRFQYARGLANFGYLERGYGGNIDAAIRAYLEAQQLQERLVEDFPEVVNFKIDLGNTYAALAEVELFAAQKSAVDEQTKAQPPDEKASKEQQPEPAARRAASLAAAREAANKAATLFGRFHDARTRSNRFTDPRAVQGLALSLVMLALVERDTNPAEAEQNARDARDLIRNNLGNDSLLGRDDLFTLALARAIVGQNDSAWSALSEAVVRGANDAARFEQHRQLAFRRLANDPTLGPQFDGLVSGIRARLKFE